MNPHDPIHDSSRYDSSVCEATTRAKFFQMIEMNWPAGSKPEDIEAYVMRTHIVIFTKQWIYFLKARSSADALVPRYKWPDESRRDLFLPEAATILSRFQKFGELPPDHAADTKWDVELVSELHRGKSPKHVMENVDGARSWKRPRVAYADGVVASPVHECEIVDNNMAEFREIMQRRHVVAVTALDCSQDPYDNDEAPVDDSFLQPEEPMHEAPFPPFKQEPGPSFALLAAGPQCVVDLDSD